MFHSQQVNLQYKNKEPSSSTVNSKFPHHWLLTTHCHPTSTSLYKSHSATSWYLRFTICQVLCHKFTKPLDCWWVHWTVADSFAKEKREEEQEEVLWLTPFQTFSPLVIGDRNKTDNFNDSLPIECEVSATTKSRNLIFFYWKSKLSVLKIGNKVSKEQKIVDTTFSCQAISGMTWKTLSGFLCLSLRV